MRYLTEFRDEDANSPIIYARTKSGSSDFSSPPVTQPSAASNHRRFRFRGFGSLLRTGCRGSPWRLEVKSSQRIWRTGSELESHLGYVCLFWFPHISTPFFLIFFYWFWFFDESSPKQLGLLVPVCAWWLLVCPGPMSFFICDRFGDSHLNKPSKIQYRSIPVIPFAGTFLVLTGSFWIDLQDVHIITAWDALRFDTPLKWGVTVVGLNFPSCRDWSRRSAGDDVFTYLKVLSFCRENKDAEVRNYVPKAKLPATCWEKTVLLPHQMMAPCRRLPSLEPLSSGAKRHLELKNKWRDGLVANFTIGWLEYT